MSVKKSEIFIYLTYDISNENISSSFNKKFLNDGELQQPEEEMNIFSAGATRMVSSEKRI
jgi:hypothetical protein